MLDQGQINPNEFIYSGLGGGNHINLIDPTIYQIAGGTVRLVQSAVIGASPFDISEHANQKIIN